MQPQWQAYWSCSQVPAAAQDVAEFYKDKRIELLISSTVGGGNDLSARLIARFLPNHIPGRPADHSRAICPAPAA